MDHRKVPIANYFLISNWSLVWYILYILGIIRISPKLMLCIAVCVATASLLYGVYLKKASSNNIQAYLFLTFFTKLIPLYTIRNDKIAANVVIATLIVLIVYLLYLDANGKTFLTIYNMLSHNYPTWLGIYTMKIIKSIKNSSTF